MKKVFLIGFLSFLLFSGSQQGFSQCAMCERNAETSLENGDPQAKGLNAGIMYLMVMPYLLAGSIGYYWYSQKKKADQENEKNNSWSRP